MEDNVFKKMEEGQTPVAPVTAPVAEQASAPINEGVEIDYDKLSDTPVGEKKKYDRVNLDGEVVKIKKTTLTLCDPENPGEQISALSDKTKKYYKCKLIVFYDTKNEDREYLSGIIQFLNDKEGLSPPSFYYEGAGNQVADLWVKVAKFKNKLPTELSPREFMATLNSGITVKLKDTPVKFNTTITHKNLVEEIIG